MPTFCNNALMGAGEVGSSFFDTQHLLFGLARIDPELLSRSGAKVTADDIAERCVGVHDKAPPIPNSQDLPVSEQLVRVFNQAVIAADGLHSAEVRTEHLLLALLAEPSTHAAAILTARGIALDRVQLIAVDPEDRRPQPAREDLWSHFPGLFQD